MKPGNVYLAVLFQPPLGKGLHMTLRYYAEPSREVRPRLEAAVSSFMTQPPERAELWFTNQLMLGPRKTIPALGLSKDPPPWIIQLRELVPPSQPDKYGFTPHVTVGGSGLILKTSAVAVMCRREVLRQWELPEKVGLWE